MRTLSAAALLLTIGLLAGCGGTPATPSAPPSAPAEAHNHEHTREHMLLAHSGKYHFWLTAHLSQKEGNELDIFCDDGDDKAPKPIALPTTKILAKAKRTADEKEFDLTFEPAPADERPKDEPAGTCSHFVAKAPWLKPDDVLTVTAEVSLDGKLRRPTWRQFVPAKYKHNAD